MSAQVAWRIGFADGSGSRPEPVDCFESEAGHITRLSVQRIVMLGQALYRPSLGGRTKGKGRPLKIKRRSVLAQSYRRRQARKVLRQDRLLAVRGFRLVAIEHGAPASVNVRTRLDSDV